VRVFIAALAVIVLSAAGLQAPVAAQAPWPDSGYDWCYTFDFTTNPHQAEVLFGEWQSGLGYTSQLFGEDQVISIRYSQAVTVAPERVIILLRDGAFSSGIINVDFGATAFGLTTGPEPIRFTMGGDFPDKTITLLPFAAGQSGNTMDIGVIASQQVYLDSVLLFGNGASPFPSNDCAIVTATATATAWLPSTPTTTPTPTIDPDATEEPAPVCVLPGQPTPTPTPTDTATPGPTPTPTPEPGVVVHPPTFWAGTGATWTDTSATNNNLQASGVFSTSGWGQGTIAWDIDNPSGDGYAQLVAGDVIRVRRVEWSGSAGFCVVRRWNGGTSYTDLSMEASDGGAVHTLVLSGSTRVTRISCAIGDRYNLSPRRFTVRIERVGGLLWSDPPTPTPSPTPWPECSPTPTNTPVTPTTPGPTPTPYTLTPTPSPWPTPTPFPVVIPTAVPTRTPPPPTAVPPPTATLHPSVTPTGTVGPFVPAPGGVSGDGGNGGLRGLGNAVLGLGSNLWQKVTGWIGNMTGALTRVIDAWGSATPTPLPMMPQCRTDPIANELCAIWYILTFTIFSGTLGSLIVPMAVLVIDLFFLFIFIRMARAIIAQAKEIWS